MEIKVRANQTIFDIAIEQYGTCDAVAEILSLNSDRELINSPRSMVDVGIDYMSDSSLYLNLALQEGQTLTIDENSSLRKSSVIRELQGVEINTYNDGKDN